MPAAASKLIIPDFGADFAAMIRRKVGDMAGLRIFPTQVLLAKYIREKIGSSGKLVAADATGKEDEWQGKCGLVLKVGDAAFRDSDEAKFYGFKAEVGEWVMCRNSDGIAFDYIPVGTTELIKCKFVLDDDIKAIVPRPDTIF